MIRFEGSDNLTKMKNEVLSRMAGCNEPDCLACKGNNEAIDALVSEAQKDQYNRGVRDGLSRAHSRPGQGDMGG